MPISIGYISDFVSLQTALISYSSISNIITIPIENIYVNEFGGINYAYATINIGNALEYSYIIGSYSFISLGQLYEYGYIFY